MGFAVEDGWWVRDGRRARIIDRLNTNLDYRIDLDDGDGVESVTRVEHAEAMKVVTTFLQPKCCVRVVTNDGNSWVTTINTDYAGAITYFRGARGFENPDGSFSRVVEVREVE